MAKQQVARTGQGGLVRGPGYTITGDFHYCVIEAESSDLGPYRVAVANRTSPGAQPGEDWRGKVYHDLWIVPDEVHPAGVALALFTSWYEQRPEPPIAGYRVSMPYGRDLEWQQLAKDWAQARWCWDDATDDITGDCGSTAYTAGERPDRFIDRMAEHWGLDDPCEAWGALATTEDAKVRDQLATRITAFMAEGTPATGGPTKDNTHQTAEHCQYCGNRWQQTRKVGTPRLDAVKCPKCGRLV